MPRDLRVQPLDERRCLEPLVHERAQHGQQQRHQQCRRAALAGDVSERDDDLPVAQRQHIVEITANRVGRPRRAEDLDVARDVGAAWQHRELDLARDLELALQRQTIGHLEDDKKVDQKEPEHQREGPGAQMGSRRPT